MTQPSPPSSSGSWTQHELHIFKERLRYISSYQAIITRFPQPDFSALFSTASPASSSTTVVGLEEQYSEVEKRPKTWGAEEIHTNFCNRLAQSAPDISSSG